MRISNLPLPIVLALLFSTTHALPSPAPTPARQAAATSSGPDYSELLTLASLAGISLPTNPAELLSLAPFASSLLAALPTAPVLSALETAAPPGFVSSIVHDPSFAASFESAFAAGHSPSWFLDLPSSVKDYLHTYNGLGTVAGDVGGLVSAVATATQVEASGNGSASPTSTSTVESMGGGGGVSAGGDQGSVPTSTSTASVMSISSAAGADRTGGSGKGVLGGVLLGGFIGVVAAGL